MVSISDKLTFLAKVFGAVSIGADRINASVRCPNCGSQGSTKKKLVIRLDTDQHHCWVCDIKGGTLVPTLRKFAPQFLQEYQRRFLGNKAYSNQGCQEEDRKIELPKGYIFLADNFTSMDPDI